MLHGAWNKEKFDIFEAGGPSAARITRLPTLPAYLFGKM